MSEEIDELIKREFLLETSEMLNECEGYFLRLEKEPGSSEIIDRIFRLAHSIKGSGLAVGFEKLAHFGHHMENLLSKVRTGEVAVDGETIDILLASNDCLKKFTEVLGADFNGNVETSELEERIARKLADASAPTSKPTADVPIIESKEPIRKSASAIAASFFSKVPRVLICDDEPQLLDLLEMGLSNLNCKFLRAKDGKVALDVFSHEELDLVITDLRMPELDGATFVRQAKQLKPSIPVIFCTGHADKKTVIEFLRLGAFDIVEKPFDLDDLSITAGRAVKAKRTRDAIELISVFNFRACTTAMRLNEMDDDNNKKKELRHEVEELIEAISRLTGFVLEGG